MINANLYLLTNLISPPTHTHPLNPPRQGDFTNKIKSNNKYLANMVNFDYYPSIFVEGDARCRSNVFSVL